MPEDPRGGCTQLLHLYDSSRAEWQLGKTKVSDTPCLLLHHQAEPTEKETVSALYTCLLDASHAVNVKLLNGFG